MTCIARVSQIDYVRGMVKVVVSERERLVSNWVPMEALEYDMPRVGEMVSVDFYDDNWSTGICRGKFFCEENPPALSGETVYYKKLGEDVVLEYDKAGRILTVHAATLRIMGDVEISGDLKVGGTITAAAVVAGSITEGG